MTPRPSSTEAQLVVLTLQAQWNAGARPWNAQALAACYTADALFFGGRPGHAVGHAAIERYFQSYVGVIDAGQMQLSDSEVRILAPDLILCQGFVDFSFELSSGASTRSRLRSTWLLQHEAGHWLIAQHHFSPTPESPPLGPS